MIFLLVQRFLFSKRSNSFLSFIAWVSVIGVALGVLAITVVISVINGFEKEFRNLVTRMHGDVLVYSYGAPTCHSDVLRIEDQIRNVAPEASMITHSFITEIMVGGPQVVSGAVLNGFEPKQSHCVTKVLKDMRLGNLPLQRDEVALGSALADKLAVHLGDEIRLIAPFASGVDSSPKLMKAKVTGIIHAGMYDYDSKFIFMPLSGVQKFLDQDHCVTTFQMKLPPGNNARDVSKKLAQLLPYPFRVKDWGQLNKNLFYAIEHQKVVIALLLIVIVIVAAFNVCSTLMMMIYDRTREISILKVIGFRPFQSFRLFSTMGLTMGCVGVFFGLIFGLCLTVLVEKVHWIDLPSDVYSIQKLPVMVLWKEVIGLAIVSVLISFLVTLYPSWKVARCSVLEGLKHE